MGEMYGNNSGPTAMERVLAAVESSQRPVSRVEVADMADISSRDYVRNLLSRLTGMGKVVRVRDGSAFAWQTAV